MQSRVGAIDYRVKMGSKTVRLATSIYICISRQPDVEGNVVHTSSEDGSTVAEAGVIHQDNSPELGKVPDPERNNQGEGTQYVKSGGELPETLWRVLRDLLRGTLTYRMCLAL